MSPQKVNDTLPRISREYVYVPVIELRGADRDLLTTLPVELAFMSDRTAQPADADWKSGEWDPDAAKPTARCLIGAGSVDAELTAGSWQVWVRVTGAIERPVRPAGPIKVT